MLGLECISFLDVNDALVRRSTGSMMSGDWLVGAPFSHEGVGSDIEVVLLFTGRSHGR